MNQKLVNGIGFLGIALTASGLFETAVGTGKWLLIISAALLAILGLSEVYSSIGEKE